MPYCKRCHLGIPPRDTNCPKCGDEAEAIEREPVEAEAEPKVLVSVSALSERSEANDGDAEAESKT